MWILGLDQGKYYPSFSLNLEKEIMRIRYLDEPQRTEQAVRILRRYVDAETLVKAAAKIRKPDIETERRLKKSDKLKEEITNMLGLGLTTIPEPASSAPAQPASAQDDRSQGRRRTRRARRASSAPVP